MNAVAACSWQPLSSASWISILGPLLPFGGGYPGSGTVYFEVAPNTGSTARSGSIAVGKQTFTISQQGVTCSFGLSPGYGDMTSTGGTFRVLVSGSAGCAWTASGGASWLSLSPTSGSGPGAVLIQAQANTGTARSASLSIAGQTFVFSEDAPAATDCGATDVGAQVIVSQNGPEWIPPENLYTNEITIRNNSNWWCTSDRSVFAGAADPHRLSKRRQHHEREWPHILLFPRGDYLINISGDLAAGQIAQFWPVYIMDSGAR